MQHALKFSAQLRTCARVATIVDLDLASLHAAGVTTLILDFDGVLNSHGENSVDPLVFDWLTSCQTQFKVYILSNKPTMVRQAYFASNFPAIGFICALQKKPYIAGILQIGQLSGSIGQQMLIVDDRLLTGVLAGYLAGIKATLIQAPMVNFKRRPIHEAFFLILRVLERIYSRVSLNDVCGYRKLHKV
jgi:predicted HAD superfamily phosphohydrolase YqeG